MSIVLTSGRAVDDLHQQTNSTLVTDLIDVKHTSAAHDYWLAIYFAENELVHKELIVLVVRSAGTVGRHGMRLQVVVRKKACDDAQASESCEEYPGSLSGHRRHRGY